MKHGLATTVRALVESKIRNRGHKRKRPRQSGAKVKRCAKGCRGVAARKGCFAEGTFYPEGLRTISIYEQPHAQQRKAPVARALAI